MVRRGARAGKTQPLNAILDRVMPAQYDLHMRLDKAAEEWSRVVGPVLGRQSAPLDLADGELLLAADTPLAASRLSMMGGNIANTLNERYRIDVKSVKVVVGQARPKPALSVSSVSSAAKRAARPVRVSEEDVRELERGYRERFAGLPDDALLALARFQAFFAKRFGEKK